MSKGQVQVFTEFLSFAIGLVLVISVTYVFSEKVAPVIIKAAMDNHMANIIKQIQASASQLRYFAKEFYDKTISLKLDLPNKIVLYNYKVTTNSSNMCVSMIDSNFSLCRTNQFNISGFYVSGTRLVLTLVKNGTESLISISND